MLHYLTDLVGSEQATIPQTLEARATRTPDHLFLRWEASRWTYAQAWDQSRRFAGFLEASGSAGPGHRVATYLTNCPAVLWTWFGTQLTGGIYVSLNRGHRGEILADMLARSRVSVLVTEGSALPTLPNLDGMAIETVVVVDGDEPIPLPGRRVVCWDEVETARPGAPQFPDPADIGTIMFTSGTTGRSKAVLLTHN
ncbi:MAG: AMP-binding protein, partial [Gemmatimonadales bacterium]